jgi:hypothetical protein
MGANESFWAAMRASFQRGRNGRFSRKPSAQQSQSEINEMDRAWARDWMRYARSPDLRSWGCHHPRPEKAPRLRKLLRRLGL